MDFKMAAVLVIWTFMSRLGMNVTGPENENLLKNIGSGNTLTITCESLDP